MLDPGTLNTNSGPDFFNAKIRIADHTWVGDVEIHVRASDWHRHGHDGDPAYDSVVLHVVDCDDTPISRSNGETIPQFAMKCEPEFHRRFTDLTGRAESELPCSPGIPQMFKTPPAVMARRPGLRARAGKSRPHLQHSGA